MLEKKTKRIKRHKRVRAKIKGCSSKPRLCIFRSNNHIYGQLIDDEKGRTLVSVNDLDIKKGKKTDIARQLGVALAGKAKEAKIEEVVLIEEDIKYHGRVKALAEGAREAGLKF